MVPQKKTYLVAFLFYWMNGKLWSDLSGLVSVAKHISWMAPCQTKQRLKPPLFWKLPILLLLTQLNFLKFIHPREESCGTRPPAWRDVGSLTNTTHGPDLRQQPGYFCIFTQCQRGFFTSNTIGRLCLRQNWKAGGWKKIFALYMNERICSLLCLCLTRKYIFRRYRHVITCRKMDS